MTRPSHFTLALGFLLLLASCGEQTGSDTSNQAEDEGIESVSDAEDTVSVAELQEFFETTDTWRIVERTGFPDDSPIEGEARFGMEDDRPIMRMTATVCPQSVTNFIEWSDSGFATIPSTRSEGFDRDCADTLNVALKSASVVTFTVELGTDGTATLTQGRKTLTLEPAS